MQTIESWTISDVAALLTTEIRTYTQETENPSAVSIISYYPEIRMKSAQVGDEVFVMNLSSIVT